MVAAQAFIGSDSGRRAGNGRWRQPLIVAASLTALMAFLVWIAVLALTLPANYLASHWNVAWRGST